MCEFFSESCLQDCQSVAEMRLKLTTSGESLRLKSDVNTLKSIIMQKSQKSSKPKNKILTSNTAEWYLCREINVTNKPVIGIPVNRSTSNQQQNVKVLQNDVDHKQEIETVEGNVEDEKSLGKTVIEWKANNLKLEDTRKSDDSISIRVISDPIHAINFGFNRYRASISQLDKHEYSLPEKKSSNLSLTVSDGSPYVCFSKVSKVLIEEVKVSHNSESGKQNPPLLDMAYPLPFTRNEIEILKLGYEAGVTYDVRAGIIWNAIERDQRSTSQNKSKQQSFTLRPASSQAILELLLSPLTNRSPCCSKETIKNKETRSYFADDDAVLVHSIDAVMSHYATDARRINLFESWSCAGDNGIDVNNGSDSTVTLESNDAPTAASWWKNYYSSEVIGSKKSDSSHNGKMKRGHKITACLLRWAANMQLNNIHRQKYRCFDGTKKAVLDHDNDEIYMPASDVQFVSEIMRLLAARWRDGIEERKQKIKAHHYQKRRKAKSPQALNVVQVKLKQKRGPGRPRKNDDGITN